MVAPEVRETATVQAVKKWRCGKRLSHRLETRSIPSVEADHRQQGLANRKTTQILFE